MELSARWKKRLATGFLLVFAAWPLVHRGLVARYDISPWRFFGWAMYCQPKLDVGLQVLVIEKGRPSRLGTSQIADAIPGWRGLRRDYLEKRRYLGRLRPPDALAELVRARYPEADAIELVIAKDRLDRETAMIVETTETYRYPRADGRSG